jgi:DNA-binding MurR/RpiR family transcriptional regulator
MLRLARKSGFANYIDFKAAFQNELIGQGFQHRANALKTSGQPDEKQGLINQIANAANANISMAFSGCEPPVLKQIVDMILAAKTAYVVGSGSAHWLAAFMQSTGRMALPELRAPRSGDVPIIETLGNVDTKDVILALGFSPYAKRTVDVLKFARARGANIVVITDRRSSPLLEYSDLTLLAPSQSPHYFPSMIAPIAMIELVLAAIVVESGPETLNRITYIEELREEIGEYIW